MIEILAGIVITLCIIYLFLDWYMHKYSVRQSDLWDIDEYGNKTDPYKADDSEG